MATATKKITVKNAAPPAKKATPARAVAPAAKKAAPLKKAAAPVAKKAVPVSTKAAAPVAKKAVPVSTKAAAPAKKVAATAKKTGPVGPQHRVYVIEVKVLDKSIEWDYYVGYTNEFYKERWKKYERLAGSVSKFFRTKKVQALDYRYDLMSGWGPYATKAEGITAEGDLALYLQDQGYRVYSDQLKVAKQRRRDGIPMMYPKVPKKRAAKKAMSDR